MKNGLLSKQCSKSTLYHRYAYALYIILAFWLAYKGDYVWAFTNLGIALIFDPFNTTVKWQDRPLYQKAWLLFHLAIMLTGLTILYFQKH